MKTVLLYLSLLLATIAAADEKPNVIIFITDDHGTVDLNCLGSEDLITPNIDRIAANGITFTQAYAHKVCCPARASLLTGLHSQRVGINHWTQGDRKGSDSTNCNMIPEAITIAETLKGAGYSTGLFGKWHVGAKVGHGPMEQGFDRFWGHLGGFIDNYNHYFLHRKGFHDLYDNNTEIFRKDEYFPELMIQEAIKFINEKQSVPFFAYIAFNLPHYPEQPSGKYANAYADLPMPRQAYARMVSTVDEYIGQVMTQLEKNNVLENTIVIFQGDNGYSRENKGPIDIPDHNSGLPQGHYYSAHGGGGNSGKWLGAKGDFLEGGIRTPALMSYPAKLPKGESRDQIVTVMDWFPTVLDLANIKAPGLNFDGHSILPLVENPKAESNHKTLHFAWANSWAVREGDWKLIGVENRKSGKTHYSLHNLADAQPEKKNYAKDKPELLKRLLAKHEQWHADVSN